jgi:hypothetical protein
MKITKAQFALRATAFQIYFYLLMKLNAQNPQQQERRIVTCSKGELERFFQHHPNTVRLALDLELERDFHFIQKLPDEPDAAKNRIRITTEDQWNFALIRQIIVDKSMKRKAPKPDESLFDGVLADGTGSQGETLEKSAGGILNISPKSDDEK